MSVQYPSGSVQGLCAAAAIVFVAGVSFLGYLAYETEGPWTIADLLIAAGLLAGGMALAFTPFLATGPRDDAMRWARWAFLTGALLILLAVVLAIALSVLAPNTDSDLDIRESSQKQKT
jgi:hypothetical protein